MAERYADQLDKASAVAQEFIEQSTRAARELNKPEQVQNEDGTWPHPDCVDCGEDIPEGRLKLGRVRCVDCQEYLEKRSGRI